MQMQLAWRVSARSSWNKHVNNTLEIIRLGTKMPLGNGYLFLNHRFFLSSDEKHLKLCLSDRLHRAGCSNLWTVISSLFLSVYNSMSYRVCFCCSSGNSLHYFLVFKSIFHGCWLHLMVDHPSTYSLNALEINQNKVKQEALVSIYGLLNPGNPWQLFSYCISIMKWLKPTARRPKASGTHWDNLCTYCNKQPGSTTLANSNQSDF